MASKKKVRKKKSKRSKRGDDAAQYAEAMQGILDGSLGAVVQLYETRNGQGELEMEVDVEEDA